MASLLLILQLNKISITLLWRSLGHLTNKWMYSMKFGTTCCWMLEKRWKVKSRTFLSDVQTHESSLTIMMKLMTAIEVLEKQIKKRDGVPYLWRLLVRVDLSLSNQIMVTFMHFYDDFFFSQERGYKLANKPEEKFANEKATSLESCYFNWGNNHRTKSWPVLFYVYIHHLKIQYFIGLNSIQN